MDEECRHIGIIGMGAYGGNESYEKGDTFYETKRRKEMILATSPQELIESKISVLLVESADDEAASLESILLQCNYNVKRMKSVSDALSWLKTDEGMSMCNLILLDTFGSDCHGLMLLKEITSSDVLNSIAVVMMGSEQSVDMSIRCIGNGACDYLIKPLRKNELLNLWQHVWRKSISEVEPFVGSNNGQGSGSGSRGGSAGGSDNDVDNLEQERYMNGNYDNGNANGSSDGNSEKGSHKRSSANGESNNVESNTSRQIAAKGNDRSGVELPNAKRQKLVAFMGSTPSNTSGDALASSSKQAILLRSKQDSSSYSTVFAKSQSDPGKIDQLVERAAKIKDLSQQGAESELGHNSGTMNDSRNESAKTPKEIQSMSSRNSSSVSIRGSGSAFKPFPRNLDPTSSLSKEKDIYSDSRGTREESKMQNVEVERIAFAAQQMSNPIMNLVFSPKHGDQSFSDIHGSFTPPLSNPPLIPTRLSSPPLLPSGNMSNTVGSEVSQCHRLEALSKYREKRKQRTFERKVLYKSRQKLAKQRPRFKGQFVRQKSL